MVGNIEPFLTWGQQVRSARGFKRVGRHSEYAIYTVWRCVRRGPGGSNEPPEPRICFYRLWRTEVVRDFSAVDIEPAHGVGVPFRVICEHSPPVGKISHVHHVRTVVDRQGIILTALTL
jgi:hypothetical protein